MNLMLLLVQDDRDDALFFLRMFSRGGDSFRVEVVTDGEGRFRTRTELYRRLSLESSQNVPLFGILTELAFRTKGAHSMSGKSRNIVVIGTSMGGLDALDKLIGQLPTDLPASLLIVQHMAPENTAEALLHRLGKYRSFDCKLAGDGQAFEQGRIYIAPPDQHLLIKGAHLLVTKGARENRYRPAIDPLFRSAAVSHGSAVIGVVLTGLLDDGTAGLSAIKRCGGVTVIQDPQDAAYPNMPQSALENVAIDHCVPLDVMGPLLERLIREPRGKPRAIPDDIRTEAVIAERVLSDVAQVEGLGEQVPYNCPNCGGVLWEMSEPKIGRYRCHTGHSFTASALLMSQDEKLEETLWVSLRMLEERKILLNHMAQTERGAARNSAAERAREAETHITRIREMLRQKPGGKAN